MSNNLSELLRLIRDEGTFCESDRASTCEALRKHPKFKEPEFQKAYTIFLHDIGADHWPNAFTYELCPEQYKDFHEDHPK